MAYHTEQGAPNLSKRKLKLRKTRKGRRQRRSANISSPSMHSENMNKKHLLDENIKEDAMIAQLAKSLKLKSSCVTKPFCDDGLDYLLEPCDQVDNSKGSRKLLGSSAPGGSPKKRCIDAVSSESSSPRASSLSSFSSVGSSEFRADNVSLDSISSVFESTVTCKGNSPRKAEIEKVIKGGSDCGFVDSSDVEDSDNKLFLTLKRQVKGSLNRLAEANMHKIATQLESLYMSNSRNNMNKILVEAVVGSVVTSVRASERLVLETCMLLSILHANVDMSVGAKVVYDAAQQFDLHFSEEGSDDCKKIDNIVLLIGFLYNYKVVGEVLIYDVLNLLAERFSEKDVELILLLLRIVGMSLRKNNSIQLKELIFKIQKKATDAKESENGSRAKYMLDVLLAVKNNNVQNIPNYDSDHMEHMKKTMKSFLHPGCYVTPINLTVGDVIKAGEQGILRYSAHGQLPEENVKQFAEESDMLVAEPVSKLVKTYRMNTDVRRSIFTILVTAEDYMDAFEKILHLQSKNQQDYEVTNLIVHCSIQEKVYNRYYEYLASKLCHSNRKYSVSLQYSVWDKLDELDNMKENQVSNLAKFVGFCIIEKCIPLSSLKVVDFSRLNQRMTNFMKEVILIILTKSSLEAYQLICNKITSPKLNVFKESLWLYVKHIFKSSDIVNDISNFNNLKQRVEMMSSILGYSCQ